MNVDNFRDMYIAELQELIKAGDRELFEDILANTVSRKIRGKINGSITWVEVGIQWLVVTAHDM